MVDEPVRLIGAFIDAGADVLTVHCESRQATAAIKQIRERGLTPGIGVSLDTSLDQVAGYLPQVDHVLMMGTPLGVKGVDLAPNACRRIREMRRTVPALGHAGRIRIGADGGLRRHTVPDLRAAGADFITPGSLIFGSSSLADVFRWLWSLPGSDPEP
jgi:ribulose-phosphate 3-epimerase